MARRRVSARPALAVALAAALLTGCTSFDQLPQLGDSVRMAGGWSRMLDGPLSERHGALGFSLDGRFLVLGGLAGPACPAEGDCTVSERPALRDGATFDPATGTWAPITPAPLPVTGDNAVVLDCALYLLTGRAWRPAGLTGVLRYDLRSDAWTQLPAPPGWNPRLLAAGDRLLAISPGDDQHSTHDWVYLPESGRWEALPDDPLRPSVQREAVWADGAVLVTAEDLVTSPGSAQPAPARMARFDPGTGRWAELPVSDMIGRSPTVVNGLVVFPPTAPAGSGEAGTRSKTGQVGGILDPGTGEWLRLPAPPPGGGLPGERLVAGGRTVVGGHLFDPATAEWTLVPDLPGPARRSATVAAVDGTIVAWGGSAAGGNLSDGYLLRLRD
jgi:hypothetical protein